MIRFILRKSWSTWDMNKHTQEDYYTLDAEVPKLEEFLKQSMERERMDGEHRFEFHNVIGVEVVAKEDLNDKR